MPNRPFVRQKLFVFALVGSGLALVLVLLVAATTAQTFLDEHASGLLQQPVWRIASALLISTAVTFGFTFAVYRLLRTRRSRRGRSCPARSRPRSSCR